MHAIKTKVKFGLGMKRTPRIETYKSKKKNGKRKR